ncbi:DNA polymerase III subunit gamma and tau [Actinopolyspora erythraea]|uniref:DNA polymerase III subunit gamma/tau n=1 Tax=Actinopolyspora erythraea TaxID=414996 RepID=A0A099DBM2_9ACTN|nr:DNA polymerase III subunit gamma and tau [Actinopolyspora erythraea]KGI83177.1 DNA polymerase III subunit gamma/tau [Actinopolyspora erythraea]
MALALYRKYRPATFGEVVGQSHVTQPLRTALAAQRINHAYLFSGPRGCGKTSSARILARSLNCAQGPTDEPCGECDSCVALAPDGGGSVDVVEMDAASHGGVDDARELRDRAVFAPAQSRYRIFVIDEAHMVTQQGFNALLKIVEEPPEHLVFVFATTEPDKVLTTIRSRTHHYPFRLIPPGELRELLERICAEEGVRVDPAVYPLAISAGGGSARDALSVLDQLVAGAGEEGITYERAVALLGVTDVALIDAMVDALAAGDPATVYGTVDRVVEAGHDPRRFASDLLDRLRDLVLLRSVPDAAERGLIQSAGDEVTRMREQAEQLGPATLTRFAEIVHAGLSEMRGATAPRLVLELLCSRMMLPAASGDETAVLQRIERVERRMTVAPAAGTDGPAGAESAEPVRETTAAGPPAGAPDGDPAPPSRENPPAEAGRGSAPSRAEDAAERPPAQPTESGASGRAPTGAAETADSGSTGGGRPAAELRQVWNDLLRAVAERNRPTQALLLNASLLELRDDRLVLSMPTGGLRKQLMQARRIECVREAMRAVVGGDWELECLVEGEERSAGASAAPPSRPERGGGAAEPHPAPPSGPATERTPAPASPAAEGRSAPEADSRVESTPASAPPVRPDPAEPPVPPEPPPEPEDEPPDWEDAEVVPPEPEPPRPPEPVAADPSGASEVPGPVETVGGGSAPDAGSAPGSPAEDTVAAEPPAAAERFPGPSAPGGSASAVTAASPAGNGPLERDPEDEALELLVNELGARRLD